jgi:prophage DNA circulation protein
MSDAFTEELIEASYGSLDGVTRVDFPTSELEIDAGHDLVEHTAYRRDGADLEPAGRKPMRGTITAELWNDIGEGALFPDRYRQLLAILAANPIGNLFHPVFGSIVVGAAAWPHKLTATERSGLQLRISWIEHTASIGNVTDFRGSVHTDTPTAATQQAATADAAMDAAAPAGGFALVSPVIATQLAALESSALTYAQITAALASMVAPIASNLALASLAGADTHDAVVALEALRATVYSLRSRYLPDQSRVRQYTVPKTMSLAEIARDAYGDSGQAVLIMRANAIGDPCFVPGGTILTLLPAA